MNKIILIFLLLFSNLALAKKVEITEDNATFALHPKQMKWEFDGIFGRFDRASIQRGYKVYREVCSACHAMKQLSFRNLTQIGFNENEIKQIASEYLVSDGPNDEGEMFERAGLPSDKFVAPYPN
jgi:ubiquinol-cytochrome c reductase cytochrome c1 subunit